MAEDNVMGPKFKLGLRDRTGDAYSGIPRRVSSRTQRRMAHSEVRRQLEPTDGNLGGL